MDEARDVWFVSELKMLLTAPDGSVEDRMDGCEPNRSFGPFATEEEARATYEEVKALWGPEDTEVTRGRRGCGSVEYRSLILTREKVDGEGEYTGEVEDLEYAESITPELREKFDKAVRSYWKFLDYESDSYSNVADE